MKRTFLRSLLLSASLTLVVGAAGVAAAEPPTVGGELAAAGKTITVLSHGNVPAHVVMTADSVTLSVTEFDLQPEQSFSLTFTGKAEGAVAATYHALVTGQETASATLSLNLVPRPPADPSPLGPILLTLLLAAAVLFLMWRVKPWRYRLSLTRPTNPQT